MLPLARWRFLSFGPAAAWAATAATAATLGTGPGSVSLGQPLDYTVPLRLEAGEVLAPECASAEVMLGDRRLAAGAVRAVLEAGPGGTARVRVLSPVTVDEPVLSIQVSVGCGSRFTRRFIVLADPPAAATVVEALPAAPELAAATAAPVTPATPVSTGTMPAAAAASEPAAAALSTSAAPSVTAPAVRRAPVRRANSSTAGAALSAASPTGAATLPRAARKDEAVARASASSAAPPRGRLRLEAADAPARAASAAQALQDALRAAEQAASAAQAAAAAASAQAAKVATLEATVDQLRGEAKAGREQTAQLRARLAQAEASSGWVVPLMVTAGLLAALAAWLAWRVGRLQAAQRESWQAGLTTGFATGAASPVTAAEDPDATEVLPSRLATSPAPFVTAARPTAPAPAPAISRVKSATAWPPPAPPVAWPPPQSTLPPDLSERDTEPPMQRTEALPPNALPDSGQTRDVSIEELIDLEQQAEFFIVLGQDEAAIDLLVDHLRSTGGGSPLPYLKLLEIHHRRNDRDAYERMRARFNHRFNAYAPEWGVDLTSGRSLDDYPGVIPRLQQVWTRPLDAMAELEALLFRKSRGEMFDLPAYREVLFLYQLARDLLDRQAADSGNVDLLLPMADGSEFGSTSPAPFLGLEHDAFKETMPPDDLPTAPVDFDISSGDRPTSIFDLLEDGTRRPPRRT